MKREISRGIPDVVKHIEKLLTRVCSEDEAKERTTLFNLSLAMKSFTSATLEKRLHGLSMINQILVDLVSSAQFRQRYNLPISLLSSFLNNFQRTSQKENKKKLKNKQ